MRHFRSILLPALLAAVFVSVALPATSSAQTAQICLSNQTRGAGTNGRGAMRCYVKSMKRGDTVDPACISKAESKLTSKYTNTESISNCLTEPAAASVWGTIQPFVTSSATALNTNGGRCSSKKMGALSRAFKQMMRCYAYVAENSMPAVDPDCLLDAQSKLTSTFARLEERYTCLTANDAATLGADADTVSSTIFDYLRGIGTTTTSTTTSTSSTTTTVPSGTCSTSGDDVACLAYADIPACKSCVDATVGPNAGVATLICEDAGPVCGDEVLDTSCALAINTATTCGGVCCP